MTSNPKFVNSTESQIRHSLLQSRDQLRGASPRCDGFTLLEVVISILLMGVAVLGLALAVPMAAQSNMRNRVDAEGGMLIQQELEQMTAQPLSSTSFTDPGGRTITISAGGSGLLSTGVIDYTQSTVTGYNATLTGTSGARYDVRWNVQSLSDGSKLFTIAAKLSTGLRFMLPPANFTARRGAK